MARTNVYVFDVYTCVCACVRVYEKGISCILYNRVRVSRSYGPHALICDEMYKSDE